MNDTDEYTVKYRNTVEIQPDSDYILQFNLSNFSFNDLSGRYSIDDWSEDIQRAVAKSPQWLHFDLIRQFRAIDHPQQYTDLLLQANRTMTDELAFCIAHSPLGSIPSPHILLKNVQWLYHIDSFIDYAEIIDIIESDGNYHSTISYKIIDQGVNKTYLLPKDVYYWGVVHPGISGESVESIYQTFWRDFLFNHNDRGYPLLKELIQNITFFWDNISYSQPDHRVWTEWITFHPTAIETASYWIGKTVPFKAFGDRPIQPNHIAHQHNGYCGELQTLSIAAQRTLLIPTRGANNIGEDHVWREFYHQGWHQGDNWWADGGGCIDTPYVYTDGWGKDMSAIFAEYGDGRIEDVTSRYLHPDETITVNFSVYDAFLNPYDNARITVLVKGLKDITWHQYQVLLFLENLWDPYKERFNGTIIETLYQNLRDRITALPEIIDSALITTWNYTDIHGACTFTLGKNDEYIFLIQSPSTNLPWPLAKQSAIRCLTTHQSKQYHILLPDISRTPMMYTSKESKGPNRATITSHTTWQSLHQHIKNGNIGMKKTFDDLQPFFLNTKNFQRYQMRKSFETFNPTSHRQDMSSFDFDQDFYMVIPNPSLHTSAIVTFELNITGLFDERHVWIDQPRSSLFSHPTFSIGDPISISGCVNQPSHLLIDDEKYDIPRGSWNIGLNTSGMSEGLHKITIQSGPVSDHRIIKLIDETPPMLSIMQPRINQLYHPTDTLLCIGEIHDHSPIFSITYSIDGIERKTDHLDFMHWNVSLDLDDLSLGCHQLTIDVTDIYGNTQERSITFLIVDSSTSEPPQIIEHWHELKPQGEWTQVIVYADVTTSSEFPIEYITVFYQKNKTVYKRPMFLYASHPVLNRHDEDLYLDQSNDPIHGCFLGDFIKGEEIIYWIKATNVLGQMNMTSPITIIS